MSWLRTDAQNRAWRTILQGAAVTVVLPAIDAAMQAVVQAITTGGAGFDWNQVGRLALGAAMTAAAMSVAAYVHRMVVDPSSIPSAPPPRPPGVTAQQAPATEPQDVPRTDAFRQRAPDA